MYQKVFARNSGLISADEQEILRNTTIAIAGMGGVGGLLAERLIRIGVGGIKITDPESFEISNFNRQFGAYMNTTGKNKAEVVQETLRNINQEAMLYWNTQGINNTEDTEFFVNGSDLVIDEMDITAFKQSLILQKTARQKGLYYIFTSAIGFGALAAVFDPDGMTLEEYNNLPDNIDPETIGNAAVPLDRAVPVLPSYTPKNLGALAQGIASGKMALPTTSIGAGLASVLAANEAINVILKKREIITAPKYIYIDLIDMKYMVGRI